MVLRLQGPVGMLLHHSSWLINPLSAVIYQLYPFRISKSVMIEQVLLLCSLNNGTVAIMLYYCTPLRCMEESGKSTWDASLVSRAWQMSINCAPWPLAMMGITTPWLTCLQSSAVPLLFLLFLAPCPRGCNASSGTRLHVCFLGTSLLHTHRETSTCQGLICKMANKEGKMLACLFFFFLSSISLNPILSEVLLC